MNLKHLLPRFALGLIACGLHLDLPAQDNPAPATNAVSTNTISPPRRLPTGRLPEGFGPAFGVLTEEQRASVVQALQGQRDKLRELEPKLREARRDLFAASLSGTFNEDAVRKQALIVASLEAEMAVVRAKALSQVQPPLSPEQIEKIKLALGATAGATVRPLEPNPGRRRILQDSAHDPNGLPPKQ